MFGQQGAYQQPLWPPGQYQAPQYNGPPPAKKPKGNMVITRYAPPPGYQGQVQPQQQFQQPTAWQQNMQAYNNNRQAVHANGLSQPPYGQSYPQQAYGQPHPQQAHAQWYQAQAQMQSYPPNYGQGRQHQHQQPHYAGHQMQQHPQASYPPQNYYPSPANYSPPPQAWQVSTAPTQNGQPQQSHTPGETEPQRPQSSVPSTKVKFESPSSYDTNVDSQLPLSSTGDEMEHEYWGAECHFASYPDDIDPALSLGMIEWSGPGLLKQAMPSTFAEAELEALAPRVHQPGAYDCVSEYFSGSKREESLLSVRQTDRWPEVKDDIIFRELPAVAERVLSMTELLDSYRDRVDSTWLPHAPSPSPEPRKVSIKDEADSDADDGAMETGSETSPNGHAESEDYADEEEDVLANLEQALQPNGHVNRSVDKRQRSRHNSTTSNPAHDSFRPQPIMPVRDQDQEDVLAALGVTGTPKMVYQMPAPATGALPVDDFAATGKNTAEITTSGPILEPEALRTSNDITSRKREYPDDDEKELTWDVRHRSDDTSKQRHKQARLGAPRVDDAYKRRW